MGTTALGRQLQIERGPISGLGVEACWTVDLRIAPRNGGRGDQNSRHAIWGYYFLAYYLTAALYLRRDY